MLNKSPKSFTRQSFSKKNLGGFTLIELLVVIAIIGLIAAIVMVGVSGTRAKARDAKRQTELDQIRKALEMYNISESEYPTTTEWISLEEDDESSGPFSQAMKPDYLSIIPRDPLYPQDGSGQKYSYWYQATTPESYELYAKREQGGFFEISSELGTIAYSAEGPGGRIGKFWVGGTGNWSETNHWSDSWGGPPGATKPTFSDNVYFDENSGGGTVTVNGIANCKDLDFTGYTGTFAGSSALNIYGSLTMASGMTRTYTGAITFATTSTGKTLTFNGKTMASATTFNGVGGGWTVQDAWNNGTSSITLTNGSLNTNGQTITCGAFASSNSNVRTLTLGASTINCTGWTLTTVTNLTFDAGTSMIKITGTGTFAGGGKTYNEVQLNGTSHTVSGVNTFTTLTRTGTATKTNNVNFSANQTITGTLTLAGNSATNRLLVKSSTLGTARTLTVATVSVSNADFQDIAGAGTANWDLSAIAGGSGDAGGNSVITFTSAQTNYWVGGTGYWSTAAMWASLSGGGSGTGRVPLPQDDARFDANSFTAASQTVTADMPRLGKSINWTGVLNTPTFALTSLLNYIFGSLTFISEMTLNHNQGLYFQGRDNYNLTSGGKVFGTNVYFQGSSLTLQDNFSGSAVGLSYGTFNANNFNLTFSTYFQITSGTVNMGSGTWEFTGTGSTWLYTGGTVNCNTSKIKISNASASSKTFAGGGKTYYNILFTGAGTGNFIITSSNTFNDFKIDTPPHTVQFTAGTITTVTTFTVSGTAGNLITIGSVTAASHTLTKAGGGTISCDYLSISYSTATPASTWYAGANSIDGGNNSGWTFAAPP